MIRSLFIAGTHDHLLCFSNRGQVHWLKVYQLPEASRTSPGRAISNYLPLQPGERITNVLRVRSFDDETCVFFATRRGIVKKTALEAYSRPKRNGIRAILLDEGDEVVSVGLVRPGDTIVLGSAGGRAIRFDEAAARAMGRTSRGVRGIRLAAEERLVGLVVAKPDTYLLTSCEFGYGKRTPIDDYPIQGRGGQGVINIRTSQRNGLVVGLDRCADADDVMFITESGMIVRSPVADMRPMGRNTQGVRLVNLKEGDRLVGVQVVTAADLEEYGQSEAQAGAPSESSLGPAPADAAAFADGAEPEDEDGGEGDLDSEE